MKPKLCALLAVFILAVSPLLAESILIPLGRQGAEIDQPLPQRGELKETVRSRFGVPLSQRGPIGTPPISRWEYEDFFVVFEYEHVVDAVRKHRPENLEAAP